jgi:P-type Mg2+ transporter
MTVATSTRPLTSPDGIGIAVAATRPADTLFRDLGATTTGLTAGEAAARLARWGPNAVSTHRARLLPVVRHQLRSPLLDG